MNRRSQIIKISKNINRKNLFSTMTFSAMGIFIYTAILRYFPAYIEGDMPYHLAHIRNIVTKGYLLNEEAITVLGDQTQMNPGYTYNLYYGLMATISKISQIDIITLTRLMNPLLLMLALLAVGYLAKVLFNNKNAIFYSMMSLIFFITLFRPVDAMDLNYPNKIGYIILLPLAIGVYLKYLGNNKNLYYWMLVAIVTMSGLLHNMAFFYIIMAIFAYTSLKMFTEKNKKDFFWKNLKVFFAIGALSAPLYLAKLNGIVAFSENSAAKGLPTGAQKVWGGFYYYRLDGSTFEYYISWALLLFMPIYYKVKKIKWPSWLYLFTAIFAFILLTRQNPFVAPLFTRVVSGSYTRRLFMLMPSATILGAFIYKFVSPRLGDIRTKFLFITITIMLFGISVYTPVQFVIRDYPYIIKAGDRFNIIEGVSDYMNKNIPDYSVVMADLRSSYFVPAYTDNRIIATYSTHSSIYVDQKQLETDIYQIYSKEDSQARINTLKKYPAQYLLVPTRYNFKSTRGPSYDGSKVIADISKDKQFKLLYNDSNYNLYKIEWSTK